MAQRACRTSICLYLVRVSGSALRPAESCRHHTWLSGTHQGQSSCSLAPLLCLLQLLQGALNLNSFSRPKLEQLHLHFTKDLLRQIITQHMGLG